MTGSGTEPVTDPKPVSDVETTQIAPETPGSGPAASPDGAGRVEARHVRSRRDPRKALLEWVMLIVGALLVAFVIKTFLFQAFYIPS
jgi:hypothetical protein